MECSITDCTNPARRKGWCNAHYWRWLRYGDPLAGSSFKRPPGLTEAETFAWFMPGKPPRKGCWDWTSALNNYGYGQFSIIIDGKPDLVLAHRASYRIYRGNIPDGLSVFHVCDRPICCQPAHLWLGTRGGRGGQHKGRRAKGRTQQGERRYNAKLTEAQVNWIRQSDMTQVEIAKMLGIARQTVADIKHGKSWKSLLDSP